VERVVFKPSNSKEGITFFEAAVEMAGFIALGSNFECGGVVITK
jgi:hypothetical protein